MYNENILSNKNIWRLIPTRLLSRLWGLIISINLPILFRFIIYNLWSKIYNAKLEEAEKNILKYKNIQQFFTRKLKIGTHIINFNKKHLVSPVDGTIVNICQLTNNKLLTQIKNINYDVKDFLGFYPKPKPYNKILACVIYLSPGDYHRFHSPYNISITNRTHFCGSLLPVNNIIVKTIPSLFTINERVCLFGKWKHGFFSYTAVGATNVGSIKIHNDKKLKTNNWFSRTNHINKEIYKKKIKYKKGEEIGYFKLGSTIVLIFETPENIIWNKNINSTIRMGETLAII
jgi:phosphatidylserine decarboxylase